VLDASAGVFFNRFREFCMPKRRRWQALAAVISGVLVTAAAQPANASVVVPPGVAGHTCGGYSYITPTVYYQACTWTSVGTSPLIWFTAHFGNTGASKHTIPNVEINYYRAGQEYNCNGGDTEYPAYNYGLVVPAHGIAASTDACFVRRHSGAYQANVWVFDSPGSHLLSPTLQVQG
jgi:hypothetical protein